MPRLTRRQQQRMSRRALLDSAAKSFAERGFHGATIVGIAEDAGFTRGGFYANFASKEDIFLDLLRAHNDQRIEELTQVITGARDVVSGVQSAANHWSVTVNEEPTWVLLLIEFWAHAARTPGVREQFVAIGREFANRVAQLIASRFRGAESALPLSPTALSVAAIGMAMGIALQDLADPGQVEPDLFEQVLLLAMSGVRHAPIPGCTAS